MLKQIRVLVFVAMMLSIFAGTASAYNGIYKEVDIIDNGTRATLRTTCDTVGELLKNEGYVIGDKDKLNKQTFDKVLSGATIVIDRGFDVTVIVDNQSKVTKVEKGTKVGNLIATLPRNEGIEYVYNGSYTDTLDEGSEINIAIKTTRTETITELIPFETIYQETDELFVGVEEVFENGREGQKELTFETVLVNGIETEKNLVSEKISLETLNKVIKKGTKVEIARRSNSPLDFITQNEQSFVDQDVDGIPDFQYIKAYKMEASAYTNSIQDTGKAPGDKYYGITASGMTAQRGVVAVDKNVIPLGSKLYVEGYGYCIAGDTGGAIKGNKIDLFMETRALCFQYGRRYNVNVYLLELP